MTVVEVNRSVNDLPQSNRQRAWSICSYDDDDDDDADCSILLEEGQQQKEEDRDDDDSDSDIEFVEVVKAPVKEFVEDPECRFEKVNASEPWPEEVLALAIKNEILSESAFAIVYDAVVERAGGFEVLENGAVRNGSSGKIKAYQLNNDQQNHDKKIQTTAQYGRAKVKLVAEIIKLTNLQAKDVFCDIGSGIGSVVVQVSATVACVCYAIELLKDRHNSARKLTKAFAAFGDHTGVLWGKIICEHGDFTDEQFRRSITDSTVIFCNNAAGTFDARAGAHEMLTLNAVLAALFASMSIGARMVTLDGVPDLDKYLRSGAIGKEQHTLKGDFIAWNGGKATDLTLNVYTKLRRKKRCCWCKRKESFKFEVDIVGRLYLDESQACECGVRNVNTRKRKAQG